MVGCHLLTFITERLKTTWPRDKPDFLQSAAFMKTAARSSSVEDAACSAAICLLRA